MDNSVANKSKNYTFFQNIERAKLFAKDPLGFQKKSFEVQHNVFSELLRCRSFCTGTTTKSQKLHKRLCDAPTKYGTWKWTTNQ